jgi:hypothetical protein
MIQPTLDLFDPPTEHMLADYSHKFGLDNSPGMYLDVARFHGIDIEAMHAEDATWHAQAKALYELTCERPSTHRWDRESTDADMDEGIERYWQEFTAIMEFNGELLPLTCEKWCIFEFEHPTCGNVRGRWIPGESLLDYGHLSLRSDGFPWDSHYWNSFPALAPEDDLVAASITLASHALCEHKKHDRERRRHLTWREIKGGSA